MHGILHVLLFGVLGVLAVLSTARRYRVLIILGCIGLGLAIEIAQSFVYPDAIEWRDVRDDAKGVIVFAALAVLTVDRLLRQNA